MAIFEWLSNYFSTNKKTSSVVELTDELLSLKSFHGSLNSSSEVIIVSSFPRKTKVSHKQDEVRGPISFATNNVMSYLYSLKQYKHVIEQKPQEIAERLKFTLEASDSGLDFQLSQAHSYFMKKSKEALRKPTQHDSQTTTDRIKLLINKGNKSDSFKDLVLNTRKDLLIPEMFNDLLPSRFNIFSSFSKNYREQYNFFSDHQELLFQLATLNHLPQNISPNWDFKDVVWNHLSKLQQQLNQESQNLRNSTMSTTFKNRWSTFLKQQQQRIFSFQLQYLENLSDDFDYRFFEIDDQEKFSAYLKHEESFSDSIHEKLLQIQKIRENLEPRFNNKEVTTQLTNLQNRIKEKIKNIDQNVSSKTSLFLTGSILKNNTDKILANNDIKQIQSLAPIICMQAKRYKEPTGVDFIINNLSNSLTKTIEEVKFDLSKNNSSYSPDFNFSLIKQRLEILIMFKERIKTILKTGIIDLSALKNLAKSLVELIFDIKNWAKKESAARVAINYISHVDHLLQTIVSFFKEFPALEQFSNIGEHLSSVDDTSENLVNTLPQTRQQTIPDGGSTLANNNASMFHQTDKAGENSPPNAKLQKEELTTPTINMVELQDKIKKLNTDLDRGVRELNQDVYNLENKTQGFWKPGNELEKVINNVNINNLVLSGSNKKK